MEIFRIHFYLINCEKIIRKTIYSNKMLSIQNFIRITPYYLSAVNATEIIILKLFLYERKYEIILTTCNSRTN